MVAFGREDPAAGLQRQRLDPSASIELRGKTDIDRSIGVDSPQIDTGRGSRAATAECRETAACDDLAVGLHRQ